MMYKFMEMPDSTEITHSEMREDGSVKVCVERPVEGSFKTAYWELPSYRSFDVEGFGEDELAEQRRYLERAAPRRVAEGRTLVRLRLVRRLYACALQRVAD